VLLSRNLGTLTTWNSLGPSGPVNRTAFKYILVQHIIFCHCINIFTHLALFVYAKCQSGSGTDISHYDFTVTYKDEKIKPLFCPPQHTRARARAPRMRTHTHARTPTHPHTHACTRTRAHTHTHTHNKTKQNSFIPCMAPAKWNEDFHCSIFILPTDMTAKFKTCLHGCEQK